MAYSDSRFRFFRITASLILLLTSGPVLAQKSVTLNMKSNVQTDYMTSLLKLALAYSNKTYTYDYTPEVYTRPRLVESVKNGSVSVMWGGTSEQMEQDFIPIRIDAYRGLMSHRLLFIREGEQGRFNNIHTLEDLRKFSFGQARSWQDAAILEQAGFKVVKATKKTSLYFMLDGGRFDAFPRGANEVWTELLAFPDLKLTVEKNLVIIYPLPTYFFVSLKDPELAKDVEAGLEAAIADGSFDRYFFNSPEVRDTLARANLKSRRVFRIANPFLPKATPPERKDVLLDLTNIDSSKFNPEEF